MRVLPTTFPIVLLTDPLWSIVEYLSATVAGLGAGSLYAVIGVLLVLMATLTRVINFALVAVGVYAAFLSIRLAPLLAPLDLPKVAVTIISIIFALIVGGYLSLQTHHVRQ